MNKLISYVFTSFLIFSGVQLSAQSDSLWLEKPTITISGFLDMFYAYDFNEPTENFRQPFLFNHNRHNEFNLNLGLVTLALESTKYRANLALQTGTYANDNYAAEAGVMKNVFEATVGLSLNQKNTLWIDAGITPSHIGFESAISTENWTLTRSLLAENSPYFLSGAKLTWNPNEKLEVSGLVVNGWQRIRRLQDNSLLSFGSQVSYSPSNNTTLNWSTFIGTDSADSTRTIRYFNNVFGKFQLTEKLGLIAGFDIGAQQKIKGSENYDLWFSPIIIAQYSINQKWNIGLRAEHFNDEEGVIIPTISENNFRTSAASLNLDYSPSANIMCRIEGRLLVDEDDIFQSDTDLSDNNLMVAGSIAINFSQVITKAN